MSLLLPTQRGPAGSGPSLAAMTPLLRSLRRTALSVLSVSLVGAAAATPAYALDKYAAPSQNFDLAQWKLTMPSGAEISPA
ncbi:MAG: hypothetical protein ACLGI7_09775, partial [Gammaproteobacteria bacterium]